MPLLMFDIFLLTRLLFSIYPLLVIGCCLTLLDTTEGLQIQDAIDHQFINSLLLIIYLIKNIHAYEKMYCQLKCVAPRDGPSEYFNVVLTQGGRVWLATGTMTKSSVICNARILLLQASWWLLWFSTDLISCCRLLIRNVADYQLKNGFKNCIPTANRERWLDQS